MKKIILVIILNILFFIMLHFIEYSISQKQNFYNVEGVIKCIKQFNPKTKQDVQKYANICAKNVRNLGEMGDMFVYDPQTQQVVWDASSDCKLPEDKSYLKRGFICDLFYDPESCVKLARKMKTKEFGEGTWYFNKTPEFIFFDTLKANGKEYRVASGGEFVDIINFFIPLYLFALIVDFILFIYFKRGSKDD